MKNHVKSVRSTSVIGLLIALMTTQCYAVNNSDNIDLELWHDIITADFFSSIGGPGKYTAGTGDGVGPSYIFVVDPPPDDPERILSISVVIAPGGVLIDPSTYEQAITATPPNERMRDFPNLGARAMMIPPLFGPGGSSFGVLSTTKDQRYDLRVTILDGGTTSKFVVEPIDPIDISALLHKTYESMVGQTD